MTLLQLNLHPKFKKICQNKKWQKFLNFRPKLSLALPLQFIRMLIGNILKFQNTPKFATLIWTEAYLCIQMCHNNVVAKIFSHYNIVAKIFSHYNVVAIIKKLVIPRNNVVAKILIRLAKSTIFNIIRLIKNLKMIPIMNMGMSKNTIQMIKKRINH